MHPLTPKIIAILHKYMAAPSHDVDASATLTDLDIDCLDIPMIFLDIEDTFDVQIFDCDETDPSLTVDGLVACVAERLDAKSRCRAPPGCPPPEANLGLDRRGSLECFRKTPVLAKAGIGTGLSLKKHDKTEC